VLYFLNKYRAKASAPDPETLPLDAIIVAARRIADDKASGIRSAATRIFSYLHQIHCRGQVCQNLIPKIHKEIFHTSIKNKKKIFKKSIKKLTNMIIKTKQKHYPRSTDSITIT